MRTRTFTPTKWLAVYAAITAVFAFAAAIAVATGQRELAGVAVGIVLVYGIASVARSVYTSRNEGQPVAGILVYYQATTTALFTAWTGWVVADGLTNTNAIAFCIALLFLTAFGVLVATGPVPPPSTTIPLEKALGEPTDKATDKATDKGVDRISTRLTDVTIDVVEYGDAADWRFLVTFPNGAQHLLPADTNAYRVARHIVRHQGLETGDHPTP